MTVSHDLFNHKKMVVVQKRCQKWQERDKIKKNVDFGATDVEVHDFRAV